LLIERNEPRFDQGVSYLKIFFACRAFDSDGQGRCVKPAPTSAFNALRCAIAVPTEHR
jgi:hypothetical protein